ncbi:MFS transporter [Salinimonas iocasae]|uniref:CynX/NimT family MFS transporter n=1 Tax=Salinimonas iocasae TaxID=2572577 RepID=A0A5B7Y8M6_9ALTE|nr:MFS transporter [Salinimonas iocasae]QCZ92157.1 CynX/NimT family MFS transporter [Salinimonas iocasae]
MHTSPSSSATSSGFPLFLFFAIMMVAANLRAPFTGVAPLLTDLQTSLSINASTAGLMITLPLIVFMVVSPLIPRLSRRYGMERMLLAALVLIGIGIAARSAGGLFWLFSGTVIIGAGIAAGNVLLPGVVKSRFPNHIALLTSAYVLAMGIMAALWSALVIPIADASWGDWQIALLAMLVMPVISGILWLTQLKGTRKPEPGSVKKPGRSIFRSLLTWQVCGFFACNSFLYYSVVSWLPAVVGEAGFSDAQAGSIHGVFQFAGALPGLVIVPAMARLSDQRGLSATMTAVNLAGFAGIMVLPSLAYLWAALLGFGIGANFILALSFLGLRARNGDQAASLSSAAQTLGYCIAATGPLLLGAIYDALGEWQLALWVCVIFSIAQALLGTRVGRNVLLPADTAAG